MNAGEKINVVFEGFTKTSLPDEYFSLEELKSSIMSTSHSLNSHSAILL